jgi:hypothetical protein
VDNVVINIVDNTEQVTIEVVSNVPQVNIEASEMGVQGQQGIAGNISEIVATQNIPAYCIVNGDGTRADSSIVNKRGKAVGITIENINNGFSGNIIQFGEVENLLWTWNAGDILYINGQNISTTAPSIGFNQIIAVAISSTKIDLNIQNSILI